MTFLIPDPSPKPAQHQHHQHAQSPPRASFQAAYYYTATTSATGGEENGGYGAQEEMENPYEGAAGWGGRRVTPYKRGQSAAAMTTAHQPAVPGRGRRGSLAPGALSAQQQQLLMQAQAQQEGYGYEGQEAEGEEEPQPMWQQPPAQHQAMGGGALRRGAVGGLGGGLGGGGPMGSALG